MKVLNKKSLIGRSIFLLLIVLCVNSYGRFHNIYNVVNPSFHYYEEENKYKVIMKNTGYISLLDKGFKFFLPRLVKEYNLELLRVSSIGYVNGYLSNNEYINKSNTLNIGVADLTYYLTDYNEPNQRQLDYLIKDKIIPYTKSTSIIIEGHNIPPSVSNKLDKWFYFTFENSVNNQIISVISDTKIEKSKTSTKKKSKYYLDIKK